MLAVGLGIVFGGYTLTWYGYSLLKHYQLSLLDLVVPGYYAAHGPNQTSGGLPPWVQPGQVLQPGRGAAGEPIYGTPPNPVTGAWPSGVHPAPGTYGSGGGAI